MDQLKGIMQDNVKKILETHVTLESLESLPRAELKGGVALRNSSSSMSSQAISRCFVVVLARPTSF